MADIQLEVPHRQGLCLAPGVVNLNAGSCSPASRAALERSLTLARQQAEDPVEFIFRQTPKLLEATRAALARAARCRREDLVLFTNATFAINTAARALPLGNGDEILTTDQEYHHYGGLWDRLAAAAGARIVRVALPLATAAPALSPKDLVELFASKVTARTRVVHFSHVTSRTGLALPAKELCALARRHGAISLVDGAHALGLVPLELATLGADFYAANAHKWLMSTPGAALLYVAPERRAGLTPLVTTAFADVPRGREDESVGYGGPARWQFAHEYQGTRDLTTLLAVPAAVQFHEEVGLTYMTERSRALAALCRERLTALGHVVVSPAHPELATCMTTFTVPKPDGRSIDPTKAWWQLRQRHGIEALFPFLMDGTVLLRVSTAWFNTADEVEQLATALATFDWAQART